MIEEAAGSGRSLIRGTVFVCSIILGAVVILGLVLLALAALCWYLQFIAQFDTLGVLTGLLALVVLLISTAYFLAELVEIRERRAHRKQQEQ